MQAVRSLFVLFFCLAIPLVSWAAPTITASRAGELKVGLTWGGGSTTIVMDYKRTDLPNATWVRFFPEGGQLASTQYGGYKSPGEGFFNASEPGQYVFRLMECAVLPQGPQGSGLSLRCGPNQSYYGGTFNGAVVESSVVSLLVDQEFYTPTPFTPAPVAESISATAQNQFGKVQLVWNSAKSYVEIQRKAVGESDWGGAGPITDFPHYQQNLYPSGSFPAIKAQGSATLSVPHSGIYRYRMRGCVYTSYGQSSPPTQHCGPYVESLPVTVEALNFANLPPSVSFVAPAANTTLTTGKATSVQVLATDPAISGIPNSASQISKVEFFITTTPGQMAAATKVHTATAPTNGYYQYSFTPSAPGDYYLIAVATDSGGATGHAVSSVRAVAPVTTPATPNNTIPINFSRYAIYYGDFDNDGNRDIYFHGIPLVIILHGDIATPITLLPPAGFAYFGNADGSYEAASEWDMTDAALKACTSCVLAKADMDYVLGDMNGDGNADILVLGEEDGFSSLLISGTEGAGLPQVLLEILSTGQTRKPGQATSQTPYFADNLSQRAPQIVNGQIVVGGIGQTLATLQQAVSTVGAAQATNQNIAAPQQPNLPSPTLTAADLAEMDSISSVGGEFRVNEAGAATYTVPIALPAGTAGVAPEIALNYSSQSGVGNMGLGWSLAAGSSISRCRQTLQTDGQAAPLQFNANDRFCLDGQRLLLSSGSSYGAIGAVYKPEIDNGVIVTSVGGTAGHPDYFIATAKDGSASTLGGSGSHNAEHSGRDELGAVQSNRIMSWHLSEFKDSVGNKVVYTYTSGADAYRLTSISYGYGNTTTADVVISFTYGPRQLAQPYWVAGSRFGDNSLLNKITIKDQAQDVREYRIAYNQDIYSSGADKVDRVSTIKSCLGEQCSRPLRLNWGFASAGAATKGNGRVNTYAGDIFNRGAFDPYSNPAEKITTGDTTAPNWQVNGLPLSQNANSYWYWSHQESDINGDGRQDILLLDAYNGNDHYYNFYTVLQTATGFANRVYVDRLSGSPNVPGGREAPQLQPIDFNADGRMDLAVYLTWEKRWRTYFSEPQLDGSWKLVRADNFLPAAVNDTAMPVDNMRFADMNSDGLPDAVYTKNNNLYVHYLKRVDTAPVTSARAFAFSTTANITTAAPNLDIFNFGGVADLNEDGRADVLGTNIVLTQTSKEILCGYEVNCNYSINFQSLVTTGPNSLTTGTTTPVAQGSFTARQQGGNKIIAKCDLAEFRRRVFGPFVTDVNADGLMDLVWSFGNPRYLTWNDANRDPEYRNNTIYYKLGKKDQTFGVEQKVVLDHEAEGFQMMDVDSDGDLDVVINVWGGDKRYSTWTGTTFSVGTTAINGSNRAIYTDVNGDGYLDRSVVTDSKLTVTLGAPTGNNVVTRFQTGLGAVTSVFYEPLRDSGRYTKMGGISNVQTGTNPGGTTCYSSPSGGGCVSYPPSAIMKVSSEEFYRQINDPFAGVDPATDLGIGKNIPAQEIVGAMPVVTRVASSAPTAGDNKALAGVDYSYEGLKIQAGGRGILGFKKLTTTDMQTGITTTTEYRQDWPFLGTPVKTTTKTRHGQLLKQSTSSMAMVGIDTTNIASKRTLAQSGTANLGPLVLYTKEARDITYDVPEALLAMPDGTNTTPTLTENKLSEVITTTVSNASGNVTQLVVETLGKEDGVWKTLQKQTTVNGYYSGIGERFGRLQKATVTTERSNATTQTRTADFTYYGYGCTATGDHTKLNGLLCSEKVSVSDLGNSEAPETTTTYYDSFGNKTYVKTGNRVSPFVEYDAKGRFAQASYDVFSRQIGAGTGVSNYWLPADAVAVKTSEVLTRDKFGNALLSRSAIGNGNWVYSVQAATPMGMIYFKGDSTGAFEETRMQRTLLTYANWCPAGTVYVTTVRKAGGAQATQCHDKMGRDTGGYVIGFDGEPIRSQKDYDVLGRVVKVYEPAYDAAPSIFTTTTYDILGRPVLVTHPFKTTSSTGSVSSANAITRFFYSGYNTGTAVAGPTDGAARIKTEERNALGQLIKITEMGTRSITYKYDALGNLTETLDPASNKVVITYNGLGQKTQMVDPDKGTWKYFYNSYGEIKSQEDANKTVTVNSYDFKGRQIGQEVKGAVGYTSHRVEWRYDLAENGLGQVSREIKTDLSGTTEFMRQVGYDAFGRASVTTTTFKGTAANDESHYQKVTYDQYGRVYQTFDAARTGPQFTYNGVQNHYNDYGYLFKVQDAANSGTLPFYTVKAMDARGNVTHMTYGSGEDVKYLYNATTGFVEEIQRQMGTDVKAYSARWDHLGNLVSRDQDLLGGTVETFKYDQHNRLTSNTLGSTTVTVKYDTIDNITNKSDLEANATYAYHATKKHAVTKVGNRSFEYDANGNMTKELAGTAVKKNLSYTGNDLVKKIEVVGTNAHTSEFFYDSGNTRYKRIDKDATGKTTTTLYLGSVEKILYHDGVVEWKRQIGNVAQISHRVTNGKADVGTRRYFHLDHLGSINAITSSTGVIEQRLAFDPWGARRTITSNVWQPSAMAQASILASYSKTSKPVTNRGFTGHEMLDEVGIIHMNGRIYDASIARFLQADPYIQAPTFVASLNRYSYVMNNPLNAVDPTGFISLKSIKRFTDKWTGTEAVMKRVASNPNLATFIGVALNFIPGCQVWCSAVFSAELAYYQTGSLTAGFKAFAISYVSSAAFSYIGGANFASGLSTTGQHIARSLAHGMVGGISSVLQGGKFGHGFASAGLTKFMNVNAMFDKAGFGDVRYDNARIVVAAAIGGTISERTGGKFANGAVTAAMGQALNGNPQNERKQQEIARIQSGDLTEAERIALVSRIRIERQHVSSVLDAVISGESGAAHLFYDGFSANGDILDTTRLGAISNTLYGDAFRLTQSLIASNLSTYTDTFFNETFGLSVGGSLGFSPLSGAAATVNGMVTTNLSASRVHVDVSCHASGRCGYSINGIKTQVK